MLRTRSDVLCYWIAWLNMEWGRGGSLWACLELRFHERVLPFFFNLDVFPSLAQFSFPKGLLPWRMGELGPKKQACLFLIFADFV